MGCGASRSTSVKYTDLNVDVKRVWDKAMDTLTIKKGKKNPNRDLVVKRSGWKTIRIFVSSTFKDFHAEREVLVKKVFPDLRLWCESRRLHLIECDLRWVCYSHSIIIECILRYKGKYHKIMIEMNMLKKV